MSLFFFKNQTTISPVTDVGYWPIYPCPKTKIALVLSDEITQ